MQHIEPLQNVLYIYSGLPDLNNFNLKLTYKKAREIIEINLPLTVLFFGNSFYKLEIVPAPTLENIEYNYIITADGQQIGQIIDKGILRYGAI